MTTQFFRPIQVKFYACLVVVLSSYFFINTVNAATCSSDVSPASSCSDLSLTSTGDASIGSGVTVSSSGANYGPNSQPQAVDITGGLTSLTIGSTGIISGATVGSGIVTEPGSAPVTINNSGTISAPGSAPGWVGIDNYGNIGTINNRLGATISGDTAIFNDNTCYPCSPGAPVGKINTINNWGTISGGWAAIYLMPANPISTVTIGTINNYGSITSTGANGGIIVDRAVISTVNNFGTITGMNIGNGGLITTLNNAQGSSGALTYTGTVPNNYNIIINGPTSYGKLAGSSITGSMVFGISSSSSHLTSTTYAGVLSGFVAGRLSNTAGTFLGVNWSLINSAGTDWDLVFSSLPLYGPSAADTQQSLVNTASALQNIYTLQNSVLANSFSYDCALFDVNNICISAGGRNTAVSAANGLNNTSGLLIAAYRPHPNYRVGAYADQNLSVNNAGSTVNLGNNTPLIGLFGAWNQRLDGTGTEVKVSAAYGQKNTTVTRAVVGTSEAGSGTSQLNSQGAQVVAKYGFGVAENVIVSPYAGIRYTQNNMGGYTEGTSSSVTAPLTYSALNTNATTALAGVGASYKFIPKAMVFASAGVETDTNTANGTYSATGVTGLTPINFNANPVKTRPTATIGATYDVEKNQRLGIVGIYRQEAYQAVQTTTVMATYTVGL